MHELFEVPTLLVQVVVAIATGGLIGLERERLPARKYAGLRTLALLCGAGPVVVYVGQLDGSSAILGLFLGIYLVLAAAVALSVVLIRFSLEEADIGFTTSVTVFLVGLLGVLIGYERYFESTSIVIIAVLVLAERDRLHRYVDSLSDQELLDTLKLGALVFILYPILPSEPIDPYDAVVLQDVLLFVIFVLLIQFAAYLSMAQLGGSRGLAVTGLLAGGANSFAAAGVLARLAKQSREAVTAASFALLLATLTMILRNVGIAVALAYPILWTVSAPAAVMVAVTLAAAGLVWWNGETHEEFDIDLDSPFSFRAAAKFSVAYIAILLVSVGGEEVAGDIGLYATAFAGGLISSAAVSVTAATVLSNGGVGAQAAAGMVLLGIAASLTSKIVLVEWVNDEMRSRAAAPMVLIGLAGLGTFLVVVMAM
ncbi:MgtC/SapB transporter [Halobacteriales archaeon SW_10_66_29]|nr:MAG: MgtC/SapB transporter [Halobacteriales archaeon SW_10_66_29]